MDPYALTATNRRRAEAANLIDADWYLSPVARPELEKVLQRRDWPAIRDTAIWFSLLGGFGYLGFLAWGTLWAIPAFAAYGVLYTSSSDSRWHETLHGTAFKTDWLNNTLYEIAAFMVFRESVPWRWSHLRHHSDTYVIGVDPEITLRRPPKPWHLFALFTNLKHVPQETVKLLKHAAGKISAGEETYVPRSERNRMFWTARIYVAIYSGVVALAVVTTSWLPLMYVILPSFYGQWLLPIYGLPQHAVLAEDVTDHRLNSRSMYLNPVLRFLYWEMNYHIEHHMYPTVPYHQLHKLHELIKDDLPPTYSGLAEVYREIIPALRKQMRDPGYFVDRSAQLPEPKRSLSATHYEPLGEVDQKGWLALCRSSEIGREQVRRFDALGETFVVCRTSDGNCFVAEGLCTHAKAHLAGGLVKGTAIECPKHNGRFDLRDGKPVRAPARKPLRTFATREQNGEISVDLSEMLGRDQD